MFTIGLDLHKRETQLCIGHDDGTIEERRIITTRDRFTAVLSAYIPARTLLEASTESEWVARHLEQLGHEVIVADPNFAPMYATRTRRTKTDRRDARTLMDACRAGTYRKAHRAADDRRHVRAELAVREAMVRTRTRYIAVIKARRVAIHLVRGSNKPPYTAVWLRVSFNSTLGRAGVADACTSGYLNRNWAANEYSVRLNCYLQGGAFSGLELD